MIEIFTDWTSTNLFMNIAKYGFIFVITILIWASLTAGNFPKQKFLRLIISVIVAFLAISFIKTNELLAIFTGYSAAGMAIVAIIPFIFLIPLSATLIIRGGKIGSSLSRFLWLLFILFLAYQLFGSYIFGGEKLFSLISAGEWIYVVTIGVLIISILFLVFHRAFEVVVYKIKVSLKK